MSKIITDTEISDILSGKFLRPWARPDYETDENSPEFFSVYLRDKEGLSHCFGDCGKQKPPVSCASL